MRLLLVFFMVLAIFIPCFSFDIPGKDLPLTLDYYKSTCPTVFDVIKKEMECIVKEDPRNAAIIIRLHFHDCFVQVSTHPHLSCNTRNHPAGEKFISCQTFTAIKYFLKRHFVLDFGWNRDIIELKWSCFMVWKLDTY